MKSFFTLLATLFITGVSFAYPPNQTKLTISTFSDKNMLIAVDGRDYSNRQDEVEIRNLNSGYHTIRILQVKKNKPLIGKNKTKYEVVYNGNIYLKQQYHTDIAINRFGKVLIDERVMDFNYREEYDEDWTDDRWNNNEDDWNYNRVMNTQTFEQFKQTLKNESFENTRLAIARSIIANNYFTTDQVKSIIDLFVFESNKLNIAKYAYSYTVDKNNYFTIANSLLYSSSKEELMRYIQMSDL